MKLVSTRPEIASLLNMMKLIFEVSGTLEKKKLMLSRLKKTSSFKKKEQSKFSKEKRRRMFLKVELS